VQRVEQALAALRAFTWPSEPPSPGLERAVCDFCACAHAPILETLGDRHACVACCGPDAPLALADAACTRCRRPFRLLDHGGVLESDAWYCARCGVTEIPRASARDPSASS
jgi:hypothetical protein